jgi:polyisoprenoid-binding protein YceI
MKNSVNNKFSISRSSVRILTIMMAIIITAFTQNVQGQTYKVTGGSQIKVSGTSNLHDWTMLANNFLCEGNFVVKNGQLQDVSSLDFTLPVTNLKSKEDLMDTRAYKALKADQFNKITFKLISATIMPQQKIKATGNLTIAGATKEIVVLTSYILNADESIICKGSKAVKMSDHKIKAPSFMMGALKTGDEVIIDILLKLKK